MKEEALKLADQLENDGDDFYRFMASAMIRRLVEELDKQGEPEQRKLTEREHSVMQKALMRSSKLITPQTKPLSSFEIAGLWFKLRNVLENWKCEHWQDGDEKSRLVDVLSSGDDETIASGLAEIQDMADLLIEVIEKHISMPQTKPLSDEEIKTLHEQTSWFGISDPIKFARAIEERHGIK